MTYIQWVHAKVHGSGPGERLHQKSNQGGGHVRSREPTPPNQVRLASSTGQWLSKPTSPTNCDDPVHGSSPGETHLLWSSSNLIQLVQGTEQALPLYDPVHGSGPGEIVFLAVLPTAMIRYMVVVLAR